MRVVRLIMAVAMTKAESTETDPQFDMFKGQYDRLVDAVKKQLADVRRSLLPDETPRYVYNAMKYGQQLELIRMLMHYPPAVEVLQGLRINLDDSATLGQLIRAADAEAVQRVSEIGLFVNVNAVLLMYPIFYANEPQPNLQSREFDMDDWLQTATFDSVFSGTKAEFKEVYDHLIMYIKEQGQYVREDQSADRPRYSDYVDMLTLYGLQVRKLVTLQTYSPAADIINDSRVPISVMAEGLSNQFLNRNWRQVEESCTVGREVVLEIAARLYSVFYSDEPQPQALNTVPEFENWLRIATFDDVDGRSS